MSRMRRVVNALRFRSDDPLRQLHVPRRQRQDSDGPRGSDSDALDDRSGDDTADLDRDAIRADIRIQPEAKLR